MLTVSIVCFLAFRYTFFAHVPVVYCKREAVNVLQSADKNTFVFFYRNPIKSISFNGRLPSRFPVERTPRCSVIFVRSFIDRVIFNVSAAN